jgi:hypothetical protein
MVVPQVSKLLGSEGSGGSGSAGRVHERHGTGGQEVESMKTRKMDLIERNLARVARSEALLSRINILKIKMRVV